MPALINGTSCPLSPEKLRAACEAVSALPLDREGGKRALAFANILLTVDGRPKVVDFGLAKVRGTQSISRTAASLRGRPTD